MQLTLETKNVTILNRLISKVTFNIGYNSLILKPPRFQNSWVSIKLEGIFRTIIRFNYSNASSVRPNLELTRELGPKTRCTH